MYLNYAGGGLVAERPALEIKEYMLEHQNGLQVWLSHVGGALTSVRGVKTTICPLL